MTHVFRTKEEFEQEIILQYRDGRSIRLMSREFDISRNTVKRILRDHKLSRENAHDILPQKQFRGSKLDSFKRQTKELLEEYPDITGQRMFEELKKDGYAGGISILKAHLRKVRVPEKEAVIRFETGPGQQGQMDWSPYKIRFTRTGQSEVQCFSYVLGFSRRHFIDFSPRHDFFTLIRRHQAAFEYFGGVPAECLYDNEKTVVLRWESGKPVFNPAFSAFITHYNCRPIACRPRTPQTKGKVEAPFKYVEGNLLCAREFQDMEDLRATARWWLGEISDRHIHYTTRRAPIELFTAEERLALQPLPAFPYDCSEVRLVVCHSDGFVQFETNRYSVPSGYIGDILTIKAVENEILIYSQELKLLARHERKLMGSNSAIEDASHHHARREKYGLEAVREAFLNLGDAAGDFLKGLQNKCPRNIGFQVRHILGLKGQFHSDDIHKALAHALRYQAFDARSIERILSAKAQPRTLEAIRNDKARQELANALPEIKQRSLAEYSDLFENKETENDDSANPDENQIPPGNPETEENNGSS